MGAIAAVVPIGDAPARPDLERALVDATRRQPVQVPREVAHGLRLALDGRIDNVVELRQLLSAPRATVGELVALGYERWSTDVFERLIGDYAAVLVDERRREVVASRDLVGARPLCVAQTNGFVAFASAPEPLAGIEGVDDRLDDLTVVAGILDWTGEARHTPFRGVYRVRAAHAMRVDLATGTATERRWWNPDREVLRLPTDEDYEELFRETFREAVRCRLPEGGLVATDLSGGLDSSSVTATVASLVGADNVVAIGSSFAEARFDDGSFDEGERRRLVTDPLRVPLVELDASRVQSAEVVDRSFATQGRPLAGAMLLLAADRYRAAAQRGATVLLDGYDGDVAVNLGFQRLVALAVRFRLPSLLHELRYLASNSGARMRRAVYEGLYLSVAGWMQWTAGRPRIATDPVAHRYLESTGVERFMRDEGPPPLPGDAGREIIYYMTAGWVQSGVEMWNRAGDAEGIRVVHPYFDRRVVELSLRLPADQHFRHGWTRWIVRRSLRGVLPDPSRWRPRKGSISHRFLEELPGSFDIEGLIQSGGGPASQYLDDEAFEEVVRLFRDRDAGAARVFPLLCVAQTARWLETRQR